MTEPDAPFLAYASHSEDGGSKAYVYLISTIAALGGFLFGFDTAVISGAIEFVRVEFHLNEIEEGWAVSCLLIGCMIGAVAAGFLSDRWGRKKVLIATSAFYMVSAILSALPHTLNGLVFARFLGGLAVGVSSVVSPLYIAEISPANIRGRLVTLNQMAIVLGILVAYFVNALLVDVGPNNWRWMFASEAVPALLLLVGLLFIPESPRWLVTRGDDAGAVAILVRAGGVCQAGQALREIHQVIAQEQAGLAELFRPGVFRAVVVGVVLAMLGQISGINAIIYYGPKIFRQAGLETGAAFWAQVSIGVANVLATAIALCVMDRWGRKRLLIAGAAGMGVFLGLTGWLLPSDEVGGTIKVFLILGYIVFFGVGLGGTVWVVISEIYPTRIRGRAMSIATLSVWLSCWAIAQTFPYLLTHFGERMTFWLYAGVCVVMVAFVRRAVAETKGRSLEEIEEAWHRYGRG